MPADPKTPTSHPAPDPPLLLSVRSPVCAGRMWEVLRRPSKRFWTPSSCLSHTLTSLQEGCAGRGCCSMDPPGRGKPYSLRPLPPSVESTFSGMHICSN